MTNPPVLCRLELNQNLPGLHRTTYITGIEPPGPGVFLTTAPAVGQAHLVAPPKGGTGRITNPPVLK